MSLSNQLAEFDKHYKQIVTSLLEGSIIPLPLVWAVVSRESAWGLDLTPVGPTGTGDFRPRPRIKPPRTAPLPPDGGGFGRGLGQIDYDAHEFARGKDWRDPTKNLAKVVEILKQNYRELKKLEPKLRDLTIFHYAVGAYNAGLGRAKEAMRNRQSMDHFTTHGDYASEVIRRMGWCEGKTDASK